MYTPKHSQKVTPSEAIEAAMSAVTTPPTAKSCSSVGSNASSAVMIDHHDIDASIAQGDAFVSSTSPTSGTNKNSSTMQEVITPPPSPPATATPNKSLVAALATSKKYNNDNATVAGNTTAATATVVHDLTSCGRLSPPGTSNGSISALTIEEDGAVDGDNTAIAPAVSFGAEEEEEEEEEEEGGDIEEVFTPATYHVQQQQQQQHVPQSHRQEQFQQQHFNNAHGWSNPVPFVTQRSDRQQQQPFASNVLATCTVAVAPAPSQDLVSFSVGGGGGGGHALARYDSKSDAANFIGAIAEFEKHAKEECRNQGLPIDDKEIRELACRRVEQHEKLAHEQDREIRRYAYDYYLHQENRIHTEKLHKEIIESGREVSDWGTKLANERTRCMEALSATIVKSAFAVAFIEVLLLAVQVRSFPFLSFDFWSSRLYGECTSGWLAYLNFEGLSSTTCYIQQSVGTFLVVSVSGVAAFLAHKILPQFVFKGVLGTASVLFAVFHVYEAYKVLVIGWGVVFGLAWMVTQFSLHRKLNQCKATLKKKAGEMCPSKSDVNAAIEGFDTALFVIELFLPVSICVAGLIAMIKWFS